jgi:nicotinamide-nucleotide amidase
VTREAAAAATGRELVFVPELMADIETFFRARGLPVSPSNRNQAHVPQGAIPLRNPVGTAPCFIVEVGERSLIALPGVPREMEYLLLDRVLPYLRERYRLQAVIVSRLVRVAGLGESRVGELLGDFMTGGANPTVGTMAHLGQVDVRIAAKAGNEAAARALIAPVETEVRQRLGDVVFGVDGDTLEGVVAAGLNARGLTLALLEAGTGGLVAERLTAVAGGAERVQALVVPDVAAAVRLGLGDGAGARLAEIVREWGRSDLGAACLLGPAEGEGPSRVYPTRIAVAGPAGGSEHEQRFVGDLRQARMRAQVSVLDRLRRALAASGA